MRRVPAGRIKMKIIPMELFDILRKEIEGLKAENAELRKSNHELEQRLADIHGEYMLLRYQFKGMPSQAEVLKQRQEMLTLKKELRMRGWSENG
jgi:predicted nuclease with TOPRIM domain